MGATVAAGNRTPKITFDHEKKKKHHKKKSRTEKRSDTNGFAISNNDRGDGSQDETPMGAFGIQNPVQDDREGRSKKKKSSRHHRGDNGDDMESERHKRSKS